MQMFIIDQDLELWEIIKRGQNVPMKPGPNNVEVPKADTEHNRDDLESIAKNFKAMNLLYCGLSPDEFN